MEERGRIRNRPFCSVHNEPFILYCLESKVFYIIYFNFLGGNTKPPQKPLKWIKDKTRSSKIYFRQNEVSDMNRFLALDF